MIRLLILLALLVPSACAQGSISNWVFIVMENRSADELFGHFPGVTDYPVTTGMHNGSPITLTHCSAMATELDLPHDHTAAITAIDGGAMDGFQTTPQNGYCYEDGGDIPFLYDMATRYGIADHAFAPNTGPSFPSHMYLIAGQTNEIVDNPVTQDSSTAWACLANVVGGGQCGAGTYPCSLPSSDGKKVVVNDQTVSGLPASYHAGICGGNCSDGTFCRNTSDCASCSANNVPPQISCTTKVGDTACNGQGTNATCQPTRCVMGSLGCPCLNSTVVTDVMTELTGAGVTHKWYGPGTSDHGSIWVAPYYVTSGAWGSENANVQSISQFKSDVANKALPTVSFISPPYVQGAHPGLGTLHDGEAWLQSLIQPILSSSTIYNHVVIFVWFDDFGGFYDHIAPPVADNNGLGIRTPLVCIGPYCRNHVDTRQYDEAGSILHCLVDTFGITSLSSRDTSAYSVCKSDNTGMIDLTQSPITAPAPAPVPALLAQINEPDMIDITKWLWSRFHPEREDHERAIALSVRQCDEQAPLRDFAKFRATGEWMEFCHSRDNRIIVMPGDRVGDDDDALDAKRLRKHR